MLSILGNWIFMGILILMTGLGLMQGYAILMKKVNIQEENMDFSIIHVLFAGIMGTTLYAQMFSIFHKVSLEAVIVLSGLVLCYGIWQRRYLAEFFRGRKAFYFSFDTKRYFVYAILCVVLLVFALCAAGPVKLYDTDWYHAQTIRWIEEYGCVKGVANIFYALGFNNAQHYFDALFSMEWLFGQSLRGSGGFFGLVIFLHGLFRIMRWNRHKTHVADMLAVWEIAYSIIVTAFYTEPYVDTLPNILVLFIVTEWIALLEEKKEDTASFGFYCLLAVFAIVCKTSVVMVILLAAYAVYLLVRHKKGIQIWMYLGIGFMITVPYFITNVITSGYLVYLLTSIDIFHVNWKVNPAVLEYCVDNMVAFARKPAAPMEEVLTGKLSWIPEWFGAESISHRILYLAIMGIVLYDLIQIGISIVRKRDLDFPMLWSRISMYMGLVYWFFTIPQVRYCWSFLIFVVAVVPMYYWEKERLKMEMPSCSVKDMIFSKKYPFFLKGIMGISLVILCLYSGFYSIRTVGYMKANAEDYLIVQADYKQYTCDTIQKDGQTFYIMRDNGDIVCGYHNFPYLENKENLDYLIIGERLKDGFRLENVE